MLTLSQMPTLRSTASTPTSSSAPPSYLASPSPPPYIPQRAENHLCYLTHLLLERKVSHWTYERG